MMLKSNLKFTKMITKLLRGLLGRSESKTEEFKTVCRSIEIEREKRKALIKKAGESYVNGKPLILEPKEITLKIAT